MNEIENLYEEITLQTLMRNLMTTAAMSSMKMTL